MRNDELIFRISVISDTHGLLRPEAKKHLKRSSLIIHAGDLGGYYIAEELIKIAPLKAVRGNIDKDKWAEQFPLSLDFEIMNKKILVIHNIKQLAFNPEETGYDLIISGHSHKPLIKREGGVFYFNPGSAGQKRFHLPVTMGEIRIEKNKISAKIINLIA